MSDKAVPVTPETAQRVIAQLRGRIPGGWRVMPIGGTEMATIDDEADTTKDVDVVLVTLQEGDVQVPEYGDLVELAQELSSHVTPRKDHTSVKLLMRTEAGPVRVEFVRGRSPGMGGYFVSRSVLEKAARLATDEDGILQLPLEALGS